MERTPRTPSTAEQIDTAVSAHIKDSIGSPITEVSDAHLNAASLLLKDRTSEYYTHCSNTRIFNYYHY